MTTTKKLPASETNAVALSSHTPDSRPSDAGISSNVFPVFIYVLEDPDSKKVRYVGKTKDLKKRYIGHLRERDETPKKRWILNLLIQNKEPKIRVVEIIYPKHLIEEMRAEKKWIIHFLKKGEKLFNKNLTTEENERQEEKPQERKKESGKQRICFRLNKQEAKMAEELLDEKCRNISELTRFLLCSEYNALNGLPEPMPQEYQTAFRPKPVPKKKGQL